MPLSFESFSLQISDSSFLLKNVSFQLQPGKIFALVGQSGSGKSSLTLAALGLLNRQIPSAIYSGAIRWNGVDLMRVSESTLCELRGREIGFVLQNRLGAMNPIQSVFRQVTEAMRHHFSPSKAEVDARFLEVIKDVGLDADRNWKRTFPHELSGGERQRALIAGALICRPKLLIVDEPTSALDDLTSWELLNRLKKITQTENMALWLNTHDLRISEHFADTTKSLSQIEQFIGTNPPSPILPASNPIAQTHFVTKTFPDLGVRGVSLEIRAGECLGVIGVSGSGKSTLARLWAGAIEADEGTVSPSRESCHLVFQDANAALNPRLTVRRSLEEPLILRKTCARKGRSAVIEEALTRVGLEPQHLERFPSELSGGEQQRVAIARAILSGAKVLLLDEPTAGLDERNQHRLIEILRDLRDSEGLAVLFVTHDLRWVRSFCHRVAVMACGRVVEEGNTESVFSNPKSEETRKLLLAWDVKPKSRPVETSTRPPMFV